MALILTAPIATYAAQDGLKNKVDDDVPIPIGDTDVEVGAAWFNDVDVDRKLVNGLCQGSSSADALACGGGVTTDAQANARDFVVGSLGLGGKGMTVLTNTTGTGRYMFGDTAGSSQGGTTYDHSTNTLQFETNGAVRAQIGPTGRLGAKMASVWGFNYSQGVSEEFGAWYGQASTNSLMSVGTPQSAKLIAPHDGQLFEIRILSSTGAANSTDIRLLADGVQQELINVSVSAGTVATFVYTSAASFSKGEELAIGINPSANMNTIIVTINLTFDTST